MFVAFETRLTDHITLAVQVKVEDVSALGHLQTGAAQEWLAEVGEALKTLPLGSDIIEFRA